MDRTVRLCRVVLCLLLAACNRGALPLTPSPSGSSSGCVWSWNTQALPELSDQAQAALNQAGVAWTGAEAVAFGEDCIDASTGKVRSFHAMQTDWHLTLPAEGLADTETLGALAARALAVLDGFPTAQTPGPQPGYVGLVFVSPMGSTPLWFRVTAWLEAKEQGLRGAELFRALLSGEE